MAYNVLYLGTTPGGGGWVRGFSDPLFRGCFTEEISITTINENLHTLQFTINSKAARSPYHNSDVNEAGTEGNKECIPNAKCESGMGVSNVQCTTNMCQTTQNPLGTRLNAKVVPAECFQCPNKNGRNEKISKFMYAATKHTKTCHENMSFASPGAPH